MQLGLFLATWGMYRNLALHNRSFKVYEGLITKISEEEILWNIDVENYCNENGIIDEKALKAITEFICKIVKQLSDEKNGIEPYEKAYFEEHRHLKHKPLNVTTALATKIMMGVFGCIPAYDSYFTTTLENKTLNKKSLCEIYNFYTTHRETLDKYQKEFTTLDVKGGSTIYTYKKAKIIDLIGFRVRQEEEETEKDKKNEKVHLLNQYPVSQSS